MTKSRGYILTFCAAAAGFLMVACSGASSGEKYYEKGVIFPADATPEQKVEMASRVVPTPRQLAWQDLELTAFLHFGVNTFTNREWGDGKEDPAVFAPTSLDTDQWVKTLKDAGFKMVILTAKHHDGFCLWPTETTDHSVKSSGWLDGNGDVVKMLRESCDKYDMRLGLYLSPWDRNAECYGDSPAYNDMFVAQLTELLSNYGKVDEVWFDGACGEGPNGKKQEYDWARFKETIERLQPEAVMAIMGDDVRWVGNEGGRGRTTEWSVTAYMPGILPGSDEHNDSLGLVAMSPDLGGRDIIERTDRVFWWPSEVDVSIRPGWFYHETEEPRTLQQLATIYLESVGRNSVLLLNVPPDTDGLINQKDVERLGELRTWIDKSFADNLAAESGSTVTALQPGSLINTVVLSEDISRGQRVESFVVKAYTPEGWREVAEGTTIGHKRILTFNDLIADSVYVDITGWRGNSHNATLDGVYRIEMPRSESISFRRLPAEYTRADLKGKAAAAQTAAVDADFNTVAVMDGQDGLIIDLGKTNEISGFGYLPPQDSADGVVTRYELFVGDTPDALSKVDLNGEFSNIVNNPIEQIVIFDAPVSARYVKLVATETAVGGNGPARVADFAIITPTPAK